MGDHTDQEDRVGTRRTETCPSGACHGAKEGGEILTNSVGTFGHSYPKKIWN